MGAPTLDWVKTMRYILPLAILAATALACANSPEPAPTPSPAPAPEAPAEAAPTPFDAPNGDVSGLYIFPEGVEGRLPPPRILPTMDPPPLNEESCEIYGPPDDDGVLKILAPGDPGYETRVSALIDAFQSIAREETPTPAEEEIIARIPYLSDCLERARE